MNKIAESGIVQRSLAAHSSIALLCCAMLYLISVTGTVIMLYEEWQIFEQPDAPEMASIDAAHVQRAIENVIDSESDRPDTTHLYVHLPTPALPRTTITTDTQAVHVTPSGEIAVAEENAWAEFLLALHYRLNLPAPVGMTLVGAFGAMIVALSISGILAHPRIFRDAFRLRARRRDEVSTVDWHNRLAVWSLPFAIAIALTGAMIGLFYVSGGSMAVTAYAGDSDAALAPIFGSEPEADTAKAPLANIVPALAYMETQYPQVRPSYVILHDPNTAGQHIQIVGVHSQRLIFGEYYAFDAQGRFMGTAGMADGTIGQQLAASAYNLHFGNYGGLPVKIAYIFFGIALCVVIATGTFIWLNKRERRGSPAALLRSAWWGLVIGVPAGVATTLAARLTIGNTAPFVWVFWLTCAATVAVFMAAHRSRKTGNAA